ncbi:hypothetical protein [Fictibacillus barbaricus]|uniref:XRE family transcriptional regulator n=1 Tax=Fictibacillus barbaricus TaxID=182136 RepID=A0ABU1U4E5_9BACL|nr:hypothetical protein [Fictibacillus barbaricus]MDR7074351.1 hypothetical protein [Fictibacillus barbaricus]
MIDQKILLELQEYIEQHFIYESSFKYSECMEQELILDSIHFELDEFVNNHRKKTLQELLFSFIDKRDVKDSYVYKKAGIDRKLFSKIRSSSDYRPSKNTIIALALALELNEDDFDELLESGGYSLSDSDTSDLVIKFCLEKKIYNVMQVNECLDYFSMKTLGV